MAFGIVFHKQPIVSDWRVVQDLEKRMHAMQQQIMQQRNTSSHMYQLVARVLKEPAFLQQLLQGHGNRSGADHLINGVKPVFLKAPVQYLPRDAVCAKRPLP